MKINKKTFDVVYIRFLSYKKYLKITFFSKIFNEQFSSLSFFLHFISTQQYSLCGSMTYPNDGWITLDKQVDDNDELIAEYKFLYVNFLDFLKFVKKRVSYDLRCLKKVEQDLKVNVAIVKFIEDIAQSNDDLFKRVQLRQLKRVFNQRSITCQFKIHNQPSIFNNLKNVWDFLLAKIEIYSEKQTINSNNLIIKTIDDYKDDDISFLDDLNFDF